MFYTHNLRSANRNSTQGCQKIFLEFCIFCVTVAAVVLDLFQNEIPERLQPFGMAQLFGIGQIDRNFLALVIGQHPDQFRFFQFHVIRQHPDPDMAERALQYAEIAVDRGVGQRIVVQDLGDPRSD